MNHLKSIAGVSAAPAFGFRLLAKNLCLAVPFQHISTSADLHALPFGSLMLVPAGIWALERLLVAGGVCIERLAIPEPNRVLNHPRRRQDI